MEQQNDMSKVISRIRKMLALANDAAASEGERDNALRAVYATLAKHNLDMSEIEESGAQPSEQRVTEEHVEYGYPWARRAANAVAHLYFCYYYSRAHVSRTDLRHHVFLGKTSNVITAREMAMYVIRSILTEANRVKREERQSWAWHTSFCKGASNKIYARCEQLRRDAEQTSNTQHVSTGTSLVLASVYQRELDANKAMLAQMGIELRFSKSREQAAQYAAYHRGAAYGERVSLNKQVTNSTSNSKRLTA